MQKKPRVLNELRARKKLRVSKEPPALSKLLALSKPRVPNRRGGSNNNSSVHAAARHKTAMVTVRN